jgi:hypothetical protein
MMEDDSLLVLNVALQGRMLLVRAVARQNLLRIIHAESRYDFFKQFVHDRAQLCTSPMQAGNDGPGGPGGRAGGRRAGGRMAT